MKIKRILIIFLVCMMLMSTIIFADSPPGIYNGLTPDTGLSGIGDAILGIIRGIAGTAAAVSVIVLGIRYTYSAPGDKAEVKKKMMPVVIGSILLFGAMTIVDALSEVAADLL